MLKNRSSCTFPSRMSAYRKNFDKTKDRSFLIKKDQLLKSLKTLSVKNLIVILNTTKNILKLK